MNKIFYCRVGWMRSYCGAVDEKPVNGGSYNKDQAGIKMQQYLNNRKMIFQKMQGKKEIKLIIYMQRRWCCWMLMIENILSKVWDNQIYGMEMKMKIRKLRK